MKPYPLNADQWRGWHRDVFPQGSWQVAGDELQAIAGAPRIDLISRQRYRDFVFRFEFSLPQRGNSGVFYRVDEAAELAWHSGPEMQLLDDAHHPTAASRPPATVRSMRCAPPSRLRRSTTVDSSAARSACEGSTSSIGWPGAEYWPAHWTTPGCAKRCAAASSPALPASPRPARAIWCCSTMARPFAFAACRSNRWIEIPALNWRVDLGENARLSRLRKVAVLAPFDEATRKTRRLVPFHGAAPRSCPACFQGVRLRLRVRGTAETENPQ